jgi:alpha-beta hydrolase superfamily lysophospholipase
MKSLIAVVLGVLLCAGAFPGVSLASTALSPTSSKSSFCSQLVRAPAEFPGGEFGTPCDDEPACTVVGNIHMLQWTAESPQGIFVICIHGMGMCARAYQPLARELSRAGIEGCAINVRGFGPDHDQVRSHFKLDCEASVMDIARLAEIVKSMNPRCKLVLVGESMGAALAMRVAAERPELIDGLVCAAPAWKVLKVRTTAVTKLFDLFHRDGSVGLSGRGVMMQATRDRALHEHWLNDSAHRLKISLGEAVSLFRFIRKTDDSARRVDKPVLLIQGLNDRLISAEGAAKLFALLPGQNKTFLIDVSAEHVMLEESQYTPALLNNLLVWLKDGGRQHAPRIEVVNETTAAQEEKLQRLLALAKGRKQLSKARRQEQ